MPRSSRRKSGRKLKSKRGSKDNKVRYQGQGCRSKAVSLYPYQRSVAAWFKSHPSQKGLLVQFGTGTGKTLLAANLASMMLKEGTVSRVLVITPTSLIENFKKAIRQCSGHSTISEDDYLLESYGRMVNMLKARKDIKGTRDRAVKEAIAKKYPDVGWLRPVNIEDTLLIIDEAHNLKNKDSQRTKALLQIARSAKHVLLLTATPFVNSVADIAPLMRMIVKDTKLKLWPVEHTAFKQRYMEKPMAYRRAVKNHIAYLYKDERGLKPHVVRHIRKVDLKKEQVDMIRAIRKEMGEELAKLLRAYLREEKQLRGKDLTRLNAFLVRIRQVANTLHGECSPKVAALVEKVKEGPKPAVIYSEFKDKGVETVMACLKKEGVPKDKIAYFHGGLSKAQRDVLIRDYNAGDYDYLLITSAGSEGLSLKATRQVHLLEPYWNMAKIVQVLGRGVRVDSHGHLAKKNRRVDVYYWMSVVPDKLRDGKKEDVTILEPDLHVWRAAQRKAKDMEEFDKRHAAVSIPLEDVPKEKKKTKTSRAAYLSVIPQRVKK